MNRPLRWLAALLALLLPLTAAAQQQGLEIDIVGGSAAALPIAVAAIVGGAGHLALGFAVGATVGAGAYSAVFRALSVASRRPVAMGLIYILLWENLLAGLVEGTRVL
ncbi:MAG: Tol-Pal system protein TolB, partial [Proteobacteria bacterium]|nr:Tol-Pal system protein TolB [Pseudomonadota bacterium]